MPRKKSQRKRELEAAAAANAQAGGAAAAAAKPPAKSVARGDGSKVAPAKTVTALTINRSYAEKYEAVKRKQEAGRLRDLGINLGTLDGDGDDDESSEEEEDEDEHAEQLTRRLDKEISETLAKIRARDPAIYNPKTQFYKTRRAKGGGGGGGGAAAAAVTDDDGGTSDVDSSTDSDDEPVAGWDAIARTALESVAPKPVHIKDYVRERLLEDGKLESDESDEEGPRARKGNAVPALRAALYDAEQVELKRSMVVTEMFRVGMTATTSSPSGSGPARTTRQRRRTLRPFRPRRAPRWRERTESSACFTPTLRTRRPTRRSTFSVSLC